MSLRPSCMINKPFWVYSHLDLRLVIHQPVLKLANQWGLAWLLPAPTLGCALSLASLELGPELTIDLIPHTRGGVGGVGGV